MRKFILFLLCWPMLLVATELPIIGWGVATTSTPAYDKSGKPMGKLSGGDLYVIYREVKINKKPAFYVQVESLPKKPRCIIPGEACHNQLEPIPEAPVEAQQQKTRQELCQSYYSTLALRQALEDRARERHFASSPVGAVAKAKAELAKIPEKDRQYEARQKSAKTNGERLKYQDLRKELRYKATGLQAEIARGKAAADAWEQANPFNPTKLHASGPWKRLTQQLESLKKDLALFEIQPLKE